MPIRRDEKVVAATAAENEQAAEATKRWEQRPAALRQILFGIHAVPGYGIMASAGAIGGRDLPGIAEAGQHGGTVFGLGGSVSHPSPAVANVTRSGTAGYSVEPTGIGQTSGQSLPGASPLRSTGPQAPTQINVGGRSLSLLIGSGGGAPVPGRGGGGGRTGQINVDTGSAVALISEGSPIRHALKAIVGEQQMIMTQTALAELRGALRVAGPSETARADRFLARIVSVADNPSLRALALTVTKAVGANDIQIFGTGDQMGVTTMTSDAKFLRGASAQGVDFDAFLHRPVPLQGR